MNNRSSFHSTPYEADSQCSSTPDHGTWRLEGQTRGMSRVRELLILTLLCIIWTLK